MLTTKDNILSGHVVFKLVDEKGLPLDIIVLELRDKGMGFNVLEFIESACKAKWTKERILNMLLYSGNKIDTELQTRIELAIKFYLK